MYKEKLNFSTKNVNIWKNITQNSTIPERVPHADKYNKKFHNTRARSTRSEKYNKISQYKSKFHAQINITQHSTIPERNPNTDKYNTKIHNTRVCSTFIKI